MENRIKVDFMKIFFGKVGRKHAKKTIFSQKNSEIPGEIEEKPKKPLKTLNSREGNREFQQKTKNS